MKRDELLPAPYAEWEPLLKAALNDWDASAAWKVDPVKDQGLSGSLVLNAVLQGATTPRIPDGQYILKLASPARWGRRLDEVEAHGGDDRAGWAEVVRRMVEDEDAEVSETEAPIVVRWLAETYPKGSEGDAGAGS